MRAAQLCIVGSFVACASPAAWAGQPFAPAEQTVDKAVDWALTLLGQGRARAAIDFLKPMVGNAPDDEPIHLALARAYLADGNGFWALRVLQGFLNNHPQACDSRALLAWVHMGQANPVAANRVLSEPGCETPGETRARTLILRAHLSAQAGDRGQARALARAARGESRLFEEDRRFLRALEEKVDEGRQPVLTGKVDLAGGWTSNGMAGSPTDPAMKATAARSVVEQLDFQVRLVIPAGERVRPTLDLSLRAQQLNADSVAGYSYRQPGLRPGILLRRTYPRLLLAFSYDVLQLAGGDRYSEGPLWFSEGRRGEFELEASPRVYLFGAAGHRRYRERGRSQVEGELGALAVFPVRRRARLVVGALLRGHDARNNAYDNLGATLSAHGQLALPLGLDLRPAATVSLDSYPRSAGYFDPATSQARRDWLARLAVGLWSPTFHALRVGVEVGGSHRGSTADGYGFREFRSLAHLVWSVDSDTWGAVVGVEDRVPLPYGGSEDLAMEQLRVRDLMKQDEAMRRGSSCQK